jgi:E3 ubiquitin-protein ligase DOA10
MTDTRHCNICLDNGDLLKDVCKCKNLLVHKKCLRKWVNTQNKQVCEMCKESYNIHFFVWRKYINMNSLCLLVIILLGISVLVSSIIFFFI